MNSLTVGIAIIIIICGLNISSALNGESACYNVCELVTNIGYPCEEYHVVTSDGYILALHRIKHGRQNTTSSKVVFLQHGLLGSSAEFIITGPEHGLGFLLADEGYDVWMGNTRGNRYSRNHTNLSPDSQEFWNFEWDEMGRFDLPAMIDFALEVTKQSELFYIGHGQGATVFYVMVTEKPEYNKKIVAHFSMAPMVFMNHITHPIWDFIARGNVSAEDLIGENEFHLNEDLLGTLTESCYGYKNTAIPREFCNNSLFWICDFPSEVDPNSISLISQCTPAGSSVKQILHFGQEIVSGSFRKYDYGIIGNFEHYGSFQPPDYKLNITTAPIYLFYSHNDFIASEIDVVRLCSELSESCKAKFLVASSTFTHMDFIFNIKAPELVYYKIITLMAKH